MKFEYDPGKSESNLEKHGISLEQATQLWSVPSVEIAARNFDEDRFMIIGKEEEIYHEKIKETD